MAHHTVSVSGLERIEQLEQGRLVQGHRVVLLRETLVGYRKDSHDGPSAIRSLASYLHHSRGRDLPAQCFQRSDDLVEVDQDLAVVGGLPFSAAESSSRIGRACWRWTGRNSAVVWKSKRVTNAWGAGSPAAAGGRLPQHKCHASRGAQGYAVVYSVRSVPVRQRVRGFEQPAPLRGLWSHLVPLVVQSGPTVHTFSRPSATFHVLLSQVRCTEHIFYLHQCEGLFPPEKRKVGGSTPPLTTTTSEQRKRSVLQF
jgi:hypothetical protein